MQNTNTVHIQEFGPIEKVLPKMNSFLTPYCNADGEWLDRLKAGYSLDAPFYMEIPDGELVGSCATALDAKGNLILESTIHLEEYYRKSLDARKVFFHRLHRAETFDQPAVSLVSYLSTNYFHWVSESLPRFLFWFSIPEHQRAKTIVIIDAHRQSFQRDSLEALFGIKPEQLVEWRFQRAKFPALTVPGYRHKRDSSTGFVDFYSFDSYRSIRKIALKLNVDHLPRKNLLITRRNFQRKILNFELLEKSLAQFDFVTVDLDSMPWKTQLALFKSVKMIVAAHGAGLSNVLFSNAEHVVEIFPEIRRHSDLACFSQISEVAEVPHTVVCVQDSTPEHDMVLSNEDIERICAIVRTNEKA